MSTGELERVVVAVVVVVFPLGEGGSTSRGRLPLSGCSCGIRIKKKKKKTQTNKKKWHYHAAEITNYKNCSVSQRQGKKKEGEVEKQDNKDSNMWNSRLCMSFFLFSWLGECPSTMTKMK